MKERNPKTQLGGSRNLSRKGPRHPRSPNGTWQVAQGDRRYLPRDLQEYLSNSPAYYNISPPSVRTRKIRETSTQTIHLGGSSSIIFLVLTLLCVLGFILFTQKALVGAINLRDSESNKINRVVSSATSALEYFGEE